MKRVTVKREISEDKWETIDGCQFDSDDRAIEWENKLRCVALNRIKGNYKSISTSGNDFWKIAWAAGLTDDVNIKMFKPESEDDIKNFLMYCELDNKYFFRYCEDMKKNMKVGETYVLFEDDNNDYAAIFSENTFKEYINERVKLFGELLKEFEKKED